MLLILEAAGVNVNRKPSRGAFKLSEGLVR